MAYAAGDTLVRIVLENETGLPADVVITDWAFKLPAVVDETSATALLGLVENWYNDVQANTHKVAEYLSDSVSRSATHRAEFYKIVSGPIGSPTVILDWIGPSAPTAGGGAPNEVASVVSFHAELAGVQEEVGDTRPRARRRGRVYFGPITLAALTAGPNPILDTVHRTTLAQASVALMDEAASAGTPWCVWSRMDEILRPVVGGWTDDAPDTQRRRGQAPTSRSVWG